MVSSKTMVIIMLKRANGETTAVAVRTWVLFYFSDLVAQEFMYDSIRYKMGLKWVCGVAEVGDTIIIKDARSLSDTLRFEVQESDSGPSSLKLIIPSEGDNT